MQEARKRPTFAEIIQVLRKLFGEEARRNPATGPGEMMPERSVLQASTSGGSGEMSQKAQVATANRSALQLQPCLWGWRQKQRDLMMGPTMQLSSTIETIAPAACPSSTPLGVVLAGLFTNGMEICVCSMQRMGRVYSCVLSTSQQHCVLCSKHCSRPAASCRTATGKGVGLRGSSCPGWQACAST